MKVKSSGVLFILIMLSLAVSTSNAQTKDDIQIGYSFKLNSEVLNEERNIYVYLPDNYNSSDRKYPVLYLLDGETHFKYTAGVARFLAANNKIPELIVVAIPNTKRNRDFTITKIDNVPQSGGADNFLKFLDEELIPYVEKYYRTQSYRILAGHSLCGMFTFYTMFAKPDIFNSYIALSPWVILNNNYIVDFISSQLTKLSSLNKTVYFTAGSLEQQDLLAELEKLNGILKDKAPKDFIWKYKLMENENHGSLVLMTLYDGLKMIFSDWELTNNIAIKGISSVLDHYKRLSDKYGFEVRPSEIHMNNIGYYFLQRQNFEEAIAFFKKNVELHPESANVYDSLGEALEKSNQIELAEDNYEKAYNIAETKKHPNTQIYKTNYERVKQQLNNK